MSGLPSPREAERRAFRNRTHVEYSFLDALCNRDRQTGIYRSQVAVIAVSQPLSPSVGGTFEEAATPLVAHNARGAFRETLQQFTLENRRMTTGSSAIMQHSSDISRMRWRALCFK
jgi:hypothetical protein